MNTEQNFQKSSPKIFKKGLNNIYISKRPIPPKKIFLIKKNQKQTFSKVQDSPYADLSQLHKPNFSEALYILTNVFCLQ